MASEIQFQAALSASKNGARVSQSFGLAMDMAGEDMLGETQSIATSSTALTFGGITGAPKKLLICNLDATNYVEIDSGTSFDKFPQKLEAGDVILISPQTATIYAKANTAAVRIFKVAVEA